MNTRFDELDSKLDQILRSNASLETLLNTLVSRADAADLKIEKMAGDIHDNGVAIDSQATRVTQLEEQLGKALEYIDQMETRSRQCNLKLLYVPERKEQNTPIIPFLVGLFRETWGLELKEKDFERAHRLGSLKADSKTPRPFIFKLHHYRKREEIMRVTKTRPDGCTYKVVPDMSVQLRKRRAEFWPLREKLHELDIKTFFRGSATLWADDGTTAEKYGETVDEAKEKAQKKYPGITWEKPTTTTTGNVG